MQLLCLATLDKVGITKESKWKTSIVSCAFLVYSKDLYYEGVRRPQVWRYPIHNIQFFCGVQQKPGMGNYEMYRALSNCSVTTALKRQFLHFFSECTAD